MYNSKECTDEWLAAACAGDEAAAEAIFRRFSPAVMRLSLSLLDDLQDSEEVLQDTFVYALRNLRRYDPERSAFQTWLFTIAISRCRNRRRRKWLPVVPLDWFTRVETSAAPHARSVEDWLAARGVRQELWAAVGQLSLNLREALVLRYVGSLSYADIGRAVGCGSRAAESRVRTAVAALRRRLTGAGSPAAEGLRASDWLQALAEGGGQ